MSDDWKGLEAWLPEKSPTSKITPSEYFIVPGAVLRVESCDGRVEVVTVVRAEDGGTFVIRRLRWYERVWSWARWRAWAVAETVARWFRG